LGTKQISYNNINKKIGCRIFL